MIYYIFLTMGSATSIPSIPNHIIDNWKDNELKLASKDGIFDIVEYLIEHGADIHIDNDYALRYASKNRHVKIIKYLLAHGANVHVNNDRPLRYALTCNHLEIIKILIEYGADSHIMYNYKSQHTIKKQLYEPSAPPIEEDLPPCYNDIIRESIFNNILPIYD